MRYLLDTNVIISYLRGLENTINFVNKLLKDGAILGCCPINITEVYSGIRDNERNKTENLINGLRFFPIEPEVAKLSGNIIRVYRAKGITLTIADATIAAVAIYNNLVLVTYNKKHYPMTELKSVSPDEID